ncbi:NAD(P)H-hydrate dehydratase [Candidatus Woesearchaeota archaeon]|nr:NAD(P)H-hydrate dehydratase [Candidatus Woesearchaeota archaeon]|tara:strand:- start:252 stop:1076 length:825 start_codon:yes stop_codon:yes gene_type:complete
MEKEKKPILTKESLRFPNRKKSSHKGDNGRVLIVGGSEDYVGCLVLAGLAALRSGADWVTVAAPEKVAWAVNCYTPELITKKFDCGYFSGEQSKGIVELSKEFDAVLIGNGLGLRDETKAFVKDVVGSVRKPLVIDAEGVKALRVQDVHNAIFTPHKREFEVLLKNSKVKDVKDIIDNNIIVVKGAVDKIISKDKVFYNKTGNEGMTKSGTGDVLAGLCVGFLAQSGNLLQSAVNAVYINGAIGDLLKKKKGFAYIAGDMVNEIKELRRLLQKS